MADAKISALPAASTPLAGTEVVPIVQSGSTKKVAVTDLTAGRDVDMRNLTTTGATILGDAQADTLNVGNGDIVKDASGNTGFGTASPAAKVDVRTANGATVIAGRVNNVGVGSEAGYFETRAPNASGAARIWAQIKTVIGNATTGAEASAVVITTQRAGVFTEGVRLTDTGNFSIANGNLAIGTAAKGVNFTANTPAAGMTSQLLNWYEEGTWTPTIAFGGAAVGLTYSTQQGYYTRIGNQVTVWLRIALSNKGSSTGNATIDGLPFTPGTGAWATAVMDALSMSGLTAGGATFVGTSPTNATLYPFISTTTSRIQLTDTYFTNSSDIRLGITFKV